MNQLLLLLLPQEGLFEMNECVFSAGVATRRWRWWGWCAALFVALCWSCYIMFIDVGLFSFLFFLAFLPPPPHSVSSPLICSHYLLSSPLCPRCGHLFCPCRQEGDQRVKWLLIILRYTERGDGWVVGEGGGSSVSAIYDAFEKRHHPLCCLIYSLKHKMWINPLQNIISNRCYVSSVFTKNYMSSCLRI